jgi:hypothetical protein
MTSKLKSLLGLGLCLAALQSQAYVILQDNFAYPSGPLDTNSGFVWGPGYGNAPLADYINSTGSGIITQGTSSKADQPWRYFTNGDILSAGYGSGAPAATNYPINYMPGGKAGANVYFPSSAFPLGKFGCFTSNSPSSTLYYSFTFQIPSYPGAGVVGNAAQYFCYLADTNFNYRCKIWTATNGIVGSPTAVFRLAISDSTYTTNTVQQDLSYGTTYQVIARYVLTNGASSLWVQPTSSPTQLSETNTNSMTFATNTGTFIFSTNGYASATNDSVCLFGLRNYFTGPINMQNLTVGTLFQDVAPGSTNPPTVLIQPRDNPQAFEGQTTTFATLASGDPSITYQWYSVIGGVTNMLSGQTNGSLTLTSLTSAQSGSYYATIANPSGTTQTRSALLTVSAQPVAPTIQTNLVGSTNTTGDTVNFTVVSTNGVPAPTFKFYMISNSMSGLVTNLLASQASSMLTLTSVTTNNNGSYFVLITNYFGGAQFNGVYGYSVTSAVVPLVVNPPSTASILALRQMTTLTNGPSYNYYSPTNTTAIYIVQGIVTTWTNMTTAGNSEFYIQDNTGAIAVFWSGAPASTNLPAAGDLVQVTAPLSQFDGLLEIEPVFGNPLESVQIISSNNPLPAPMPLPFDPNLLNNAVAMNNLQSSYFVASNVYLTSTPATFPSGATESITNILASGTLMDTDPSGMFDYVFTNAAGSSDTIFWNPYTDIIGTTKPTGPVTIYGVLGYFSGTYEITPSRLADIITYVHWTNILGNVSRLGDALTNSFATSVVRPGENLTMNVAFSDPAGGEVTINSLGISPTPAGTGTWTGQTNSPANGLPATASFYFAPTASDAGTTFTVSASYTTSDGPSTATWTIYVPTAAEQQVYITEFLANPTTNSSAPNFNPLKRQNGDTVNVASWDQYVEIVNLSSSDISFYNWSINVGNNVAFQDGNGDTLGSSNYFIVYGGGFSGDTSPPSIPNTAAADVTTSPGLNLPTSGQGVIALYNNTGGLVDRVVYNSSQLVTNGSLSRFPKVTSGFVPEPYISTNLTTPGLQYDGGSWMAPTTVPVGVQNVKITAANPGPNPITLSFPAITTNASTLWATSNLLNPFQVIYGYQAPTTNGLFTITNSPYGQYYYFITTQP